MGTQFSLIHDKSKYFLGLGFPGVTAGVKTQLPNYENHSWGINVGRMYGILSSNTDFAAVTYNYHFSGFSIKGWEIGTGLTYYIEEEYTPLFADEPEKEYKGLGIIFNLGYTF